LNRQIIEAKNIIVINLLYLGDLIFSTPFLRNLRRNYPTAKIDLVVNANFSELLANNPYVDHLFPYNKAWSLRESLAFAGQLRKGQYDLGLNIHGSFRSNVLLTLINPAYRVGFANGFIQFALDKRLKPLANAHMVDVYLHFLRDLGITDLDDEGLELRVSESALRQMDLFLEKKLVSPTTCLIGLNIGGTWPTKRWTIEGFAKLADELQLNYHCKVIFLGSSGDLPRVRKIVNLMKTTPLLATGRTNLSELAALVKRCALVISNDSGPVHVAAAVGTPTITIFGPSDEIKYRPYGKDHLIVKSNAPCRPCGKHECPLQHHKCMRDIGVEEVLAQVRIILGRY